MCGSTVVCESWYLNVSVRGLQAMRAHIFLNFIFLVIRGEYELYILSLESVTFIKKPINLLKVVYHPGSCLLHHYTYIDISDKFLMAEKIAKNFYFISVEIWGFQEN